MNSDLIAAGAEVFPRVPRGLIAASVIAFAICGGLAAGSALWWLSPETCERLGQDLPEF